MEGIAHRRVAVGNGVYLHVAEKGEGPMVLLLHGFPELWYSWRHQILYLAARGYRAVAPDLRGFGDSDAPLEIASYTIFHIIGDLVALLDALGQDQVFVVGHDWGAIVAWSLCMLRPDRVKALVNLSVAFSARDPRHRPVDSIRAIFGDDHYICRFQPIAYVDYISFSVYGENNLREDQSFHLPFNFDSQNLPYSEKPRRRNYMDANPSFSCITYQEPGIEAEFSQIDTALILKKFLTYRKPAALLVPKEKKFGGSADADIALPSWLSEEDLKYCASKYDKSGFSGGLNYYRCMNLNWELMAPWTGVQIKVPVKFIVGDLDLTYHTPGIQNYIHKGGFRRDVPFLQEVVVMEGVGHFITQEKPHEISRHIYQFIQKFTNVV